MDSSAPNGQLARYAIFYAIVHTAVCLLHGLAHIRLDIYGSAAENVFIGAVIFAAPVAAAVGLRSRRAWGFPLLFVSTAATFIYAAARHFIIPSPDQIGHVAPGGWGTVYRGTAIVFPFLEALGLWISGLGVARSRSVAQGKMNSRHAAALGTASEGGKQEWPHQMAKRPKRGGSNL
jgi:hypothetical protein